MFIIDKIANHFKIDYGTYFNSDENQMQDIFKRQTINILSVIFSEQYSRQIPDYLNNILDSCLTKFEIEYRKPWPTINPLISFYHYVRICKSMHEVMYIAIDNDFSIYFICLCIYFGKFSEASINYFRKMAMTNDNQLAYDMLSHILTTRTY